MMARGTARLVLSQTSVAFWNTLKRMLPSTWKNLRKSVARRYRGKARVVAWDGEGELREVLRETVDHLAPDDKVMAAPGFQLEPGLKRPTQKQKVRFIVKARSKELFRCSGRGGSRKI